MPQLKREIILILSELDSVNFGSEEWSRGAGSDPQEPFRFSGDLLFGVTQPLDTFSLRRTA